MSSKAEVRSGTGHTFQNFQVQILLLTLLSLVDLEKLFCLFSFLDSSPIKLAGRREVPNS